MEIPSSHIENYSVAVNEAVERIQNELRSQLRLIDFSKPIDEVRNEVIAIMDAYCDAASIVGARLSAEFYANTRNAATGGYYIPSLQTGRDPRDTENAVRAFMETLIEGEEDAEEEFENLLVERVELETKWSIARNTIDNVRIDPLKPRFARVPQGEKTCDFCIMLASRGPVYLTEESAGAFTSFHNHCDCKVVPFFDEKTTVAGYDPAAYYEQYQELMKDPTFAARMQRAATRAQERAKERKKLGM